MDRSIEIQLWQTRLELIQAQHVILSYQEREAREQLQRVQAANVPPDGAGREMSDLKGAST